MPNCRRIPPLTMEMKNFTSLFEEASTELQLPFEKVALVCVEEKLSLVQRYKLNEVIKSAKARNHVQHFSEFRKEFPECDADPQAVYEEILNSKEKIKLLN